MCSGVVGALVLREVQIVARRQNKNMFHVSQGLLAGFVTVDLCEMRL